jgi:hypothetical protein
MHIEGVKTLWEQCHLDNASHKVKVNHIKEPTDKFKLEHLRDALLKTLTGQ